MTRDFRCYRGCLTRSAGNQLTWEIQSHGHLAIVAVDGELDVGTAPGLDGQLASLANTGSHLILDLAGVRFCDCAGLSLFLRPSSAHAPLAVRCTWLRPSRRCVA